MTLEKPLEHVEADVPSGGAHGDVFAVDAVPDGEPRAAGDRLQLPADVLTAPAEFEEARSVGTFDLALRYLRRSDRRQRCFADGAEVAVGVEGSPFAEL